MRILRGANLSAAIILLVCFFMPWVQVSCAGASDSLRGLDLARDGHTSLWLVPLLMCAVVLSAIVRVRREPNSTLAVVSTISGLLSAYLVNRERWRAHDESGVISAQLTGWFWLGFISTLALAVSGIYMLLKRRAP